MLLTRVRRLAREPNGAFSPAGSLPEGAFPADPDAFGEAEAEVVEHGGGPLRRIAVPRTAGSGFTSFLDGIQRTGILLYHGPVPIVYAYAAAVIRTRGGRAAPEGRLRTFLRDEREALFFPFRLVAPSALAGCGAAAEQMVDTSPAEAAPVPIFPPLLYAWAAQRVATWREEVEAQVAERWCRQDEDPGHLLVDGSLTLSRELAACARAVGVIKSHLTRFFDGDDARTLLSLEEGERTSVFRPGTRQFTPVYSWYLRLRSPAGSGALWGLVRVEAPATAATLRRADQISGWLLAETAPIALPDPRWDRMLYPIRDCEQYLRSRAPRL
ncbi:MAG TPA: hypothetical protein VFQ38_20535 [Longimicrobiales bacterium]|nr:hypothetical protein [Longimicrobiales bacterium]